MGDVKMRDDSGASSSDDEGDAGLPWNLGFCEPPTTQAALLRHRFPSKVGGRPAWLHPVDLPTPGQLTCRATNQPLDFLLQLYAPVDDGPDDAFHRTIFIFVSPAGGQLAAPGAVRAFRCQLPRSNPFYPQHPPGDADVQPPPLSEAQAAQAAAIDRWHVAAAERATAGGAGAPDAPPPAAMHVFPEHELVVEPEECSDDEEEGNGARGDKGGDAVKRLMAEYAKQQAGEGPLDEEELPGEVLDRVEAQATPELRHFADFAARIAAAPDQCVRYCFEPGAKPLTPNPGGVPGPADVPPCQRCGAPRRFEFQVMPQLLHYLGQPADDPNSLDWGALAVYCCTASCSPQGGVPLKEGSASYVEEWVWVQRPDQAVGGGAQR